MRYYPNKTIKKRADSISLLSFNNITKAKKLKVGVPLPTFLLTQRVRSSTISTSIIFWQMLFYLMSVYKNYSLL